MLACMGILLITGACALFVKYQPRILENQMLCGMMAVMGLVDRKSTRQNSSHIRRSRMPSSA